MRLTDGRTSTAIARSNRVRCALKIDSLIHWLKSFAWDSFNTTCSLDAESIFSAAHVRLADANEVGAIGKSFQSPWRFFTTHATDEPSVSQQAYCHSQLMSAIQTRVQKTWNIIEKFITPIYDDPEKLSMWQNGPLFIWSNTSILSDIEWCNIWIFCVHS